MNLQRITHRLKRSLALLMTLLLVFMQTAHAGNYIAFIHTDVLGSPVAVTDQNGNIVSREHVSPYGDSLGKRSEDDTTPIGSSEHGIGYTGHVKDKDLGLTYMQARYYDPTIGRFMGTDPVGFSDTEPSFFNRYAYVNNNPYNYVDPNGEAGIAIGGQGNINSFGLGLSVAGGGYINVDREGVSFGSYGSIEGGPVGGPAGWGLGYEATATNADVESALNGNYNISGPDVTKYSVDLVTTFPTAEFESFNAVQFSEDLIGSPSFISFHSRFGVGAAKRLGGFTWGGLLDGIEGFLGLGGNDDGGNVGNGGSTNTDYADRDMQCEPY